MVRAQYSNLFMSTLLATKQEADIWWPGLAMILLQSRIAKRKSWLREQYKFKYDLFEYKEYSANKINAY